MKYQVSFRAKTWYLHMWKYHRCYGFIINRAFHTKKLLKSNGFVFRWRLYNEENITWPLGDTKLLFSCWKNISTLEEKFRISTRPCNILYIFSFRLERELIWQDPRFQFVLPGQKNTFNYFTNNLRLFNF